MSGDQISVVIPTYQRAHLIARCLDSVLGQSHPADSVIVVDDGSTDDTLDVLADYRGDIDVVRQQNAGASVARNVGVARATTPWIAFCDSDDLWTDDHLGRLAQAVDVTGGRAALYFADTAIAESDGGGTFFEVIGLDPDGPEVSEPPVSWIHARLQPMLLQASLVRRTAYEDVGGLSPALATRHDTDLFYRLGFRHPMCAVPGVGVWLCDDAGDGARLTGEGGQHARSFWEESLTMHRGLLDLAPDDASRDRLRAQVAGDHLRLAGHDARTREPRGAVTHLVAGIRSSPRTIARHVGSGVRRRVLGRRADVSRIPR